MVEFRVGSWNISCGLSSRLGIKLKQVVSQTYCTRFASHIASSSPWIADGQQPRKRISYLSSSSILLLSTHHEKMRSRYPTSLPRHLQQDPQLSVSVEVVTALYTTVNNPHSYRRTLLTCASHSPSEILVLRVHDLHIFPYYQHRHNTSHYPLRTHLRTLPSPYPPLLPIFPSRTSAHHPSNCHAYPVWTRSTNSPAQRKPPPLWCLEPARVQPL